MLKQNNNFFQNSMLKMHASPLVEQSKIFENSTNSQQHHQHNKFSYYVSKLESLEAKIDREESKIL